MLYAGMYSTINKVDVLGALPCEIHPWLQLAQMRIWVFPGAKQSQEQLGVEQRIV